MLTRKFLPIFTSLALLLAPSRILSAAISIEGAPADSGFNVGSVAPIRATIRGVTGDPSRYAVFAEIQYVGTTATANVQMDRQESSQPGEVRYETGWPIPADAPTGLYSVIVRVEDRTAHEVVATKRLRSFAAYKKLLRISDLKMDKTFYNPGEPLECELTIENLTDRDLSDLRVEFSNANYPWISLYSAGSNKPGNEAENLDLALKVLRDRFNLAARSSVKIPMTPAGKAAFTQGVQRAVLGAGAPERHEKVPPPEVDFYTVAVWNRDRTVLYDMQFTAPVIVRPVDRDMPKPYGRAFTHPYNSDIDFTRYRQFYPPSLVSPDITVDHSHTLYRPGDKVRVEAVLRNTSNQEWRGLELRGEVLDSRGNPIHSMSLLSGINLAPGDARNFAADVWTAPASLAPGVYSLKLSIGEAEAKPIAEATTEIAFNRLPASLLVMCPHEDDEGSYAGLIRAAVEAGIPVRVVIFTGGDVGECERYYDKPCGPNEAREFGLVRMEETAEALEHIGLARDKLMFLGLPDGGSGSIWFQHVKAANPFLSIYLACDHAPYEHVVKPNLPYARQPVIELVKQIIADFHPATVATAHPDERHVDHRTTGWFVIKACQELLREKHIDPQTELIVDEAYGSGGFKPAPFKYEKMRVELSGEVSALAREMSWIYQSQDGNLTEGMRKTFSELPRYEDHLRVLDWQEHAGWNE